MPSPPPKPAPLSDFHVALLISLVSVATSVASLIGFIGTTVVTWRKERREEQHSALDLEKKALEIEKLRSELKTGQAPPDDHALPPPGPERQP